MMAEVTSQALQKGRKVMVAKVGPHTIAENSQRLYRRDVATLAWYRSFQTGAARPEKLGRRQSSTVSDGRLVMMMTLS